MNSELDSNKFAAITSRHRIVWVPLNMVSFKNFVFDGVVLIHGYWSSLLAQENACVGGGAMYREGALRVQNGEQDIDIAKVELLLSGARRVSKLWSLLEDPIINSPVDSSSQFAPSLSVSPLISPACSAELDKAIGSLYANHSGCELGAPFPSSDSSDEGLQGDSSSEETCCFAGRFRPGVGVTGSSGKSRGSLPPWCKPITQRKAIGGQAAKTAQGRKRKRSW